MHAYREMRQGIAEEAEVARLRHREKALIPRATNKLQHNACVAERAFDIRHAVVQGADAGCHGYDVAEALTFGPRAERFAEVSTLPHPTSHTVPTHGAS